MPVTSKLPLASCDFLPEPSSFPHDYLGNCCPRYRSPCSCSALAVPKLPHAGCYCLSITYKPKPRTRQIQGCKLLHTSNKSLPPKAQSRRQSRLAMKGPSFNVGIKPWYSPTSHLNPSGDRFRNLAWQIAGREGHHTTADPAFAKWPVGAIPIPREWYSAPGRIAIPCALSSSGEGCSGVP